MQKLASIVFNDVAEPMETRTEPASAEMTSGPPRPLGIKVLAIGFAMLGSVVFAAFVWSFWASSLTPDSRHHEDENWLGLAVLVFQLATACWAQAAGVWNRAFKSLEPALISTMFLGGVGLVFVASTLAVMAEEAAGHRNPAEYLGHLLFFAALFAVNAWGFVYLRRAEARGWFEYPIRKRSRLGRSKPSA